MRAYQIVNLLIKLFTTRNITFSMNDDVTFIIKDGRLGGSTTLTLKAAKVIVNNQSLHINKIVDSSLALEAAIIKIVEQLEEIEPLKFAAKVISMASKRFNTVTFESDEIGEHIKLSDDKVLLTIRVTETTVLINTINDNIPEVSLSYENTDTALLYDHLISAANIIDQI